MDEALAKVAEAWARLRAGLADLWDAGEPWRALASRELQNAAEWIGRADLALPRDTAVVGSVLLLALSVPAILQAFVDRRIPFIGGGMAIAGAALAMWTMQTYPGDWTLHDVPMAFVEVAARLLN